MMHIYSICPKTSSLNSWWLANAIDHRNAHFSFFPLNNFYRKFPKVSPSNAGSVDRTQIRNAVIHLTTVHCRSQIVNNNQNYPICQASDQRCAERFDKKVWHELPRSSKITNYQVIQLMRISLSLSLSDYSDG